MNKQLNMKMLLLSAFKNILTLLIIFQCEMVYSQQIINNLTLKKNIY